MRVVLVYITVAGGQRTNEYAFRFVQTYKLHGPGYPHETIAVCNGGEPSIDIRAIFYGLHFNAPRGSLQSHVNFWARPNDPGWDISAYLEIAKWMGNTSGKFMMVCMGESIHFHREGWLRRLVDAWQQHGPGIYGAFASNTVRAHINTTGFAIAPELLATYPLPVNSKETRYEFEHGQNSIWRYVAAQGKPAMLVTWDGVWTPGAWRYPTNILWRGNQRNCLFYCSHTDNWFGADKKKRERWLQMADSPFR